jgi:hypothetical protein
VRSRVVCVRVWDVRACNQCVCTLQSMRPRAHTSYTSGSNQLGTAFHPSHSGRMAWPTPLHVLCTMCQPSHDAWPCQRARICCKCLIAPRSRGSRHLGFPSSLVHTRLVTDRHSFMPRAVLSRPLHRWHALSRGASQSLLQILATGAQRARWAFLTLPR